MDVSSGGAQSILPHQGVEAVTALPAQSMAFLQDWCALAKDTLDQVD